MDIVDSYFQAMDSGDPGSAIDLFTPAATVVDDGATYAGHVRIRQWLTGAASEWRTTSTRLSRTSSDVDVVVVDRVVGDFPGGQVDLRHVFTVAPVGLIAALSITAVPGASGLTAPR